MTSGYTNRFGRRGGRGLRPWLLIPKYLAVAAYFGGVLAIAIVVTGASDGAGATGDMLRRFALWLIAPAATLAALLGVGLWLMHPLTFIRSRWFLAKILLIALVLGPLEVACYMSLVADSGPSSSAPSAPPALAWTSGSIALLIAVIAVLVVVVVIGRLKPRLGQRPKARKPGIAPNSMATDDRAVATALLCLTMLVAGHGCASSSPDAPAGVHPVHDYTLDLLVRGLDYERFHVDPDSLPVHRRSARYLVQPDRTLRAAVGAGVSWRGIPSAPIRLEPEQYDRLGALTHALFSRGASESEASRPSQFESLTRYEFRYGRHQRWNQAHLTDQDQQAADLVRVLADLAGLAPPVD